MNEDPRSYSAADLADPRKLRENLAATFEDSAAWRAAKSEEYPDDRRNETSRVALEIAAREVAALPDDDPRLVRIAKSWESGANLANLDTASRLIGRHGFGRGDTQTTGELLAELVRAALEAE